MNAMNWCATAFRISKKNLNDISKDRSDLRVFKMIRIYDAMRTGGDVLKLIRQSVGKQAFDENGRIDFDLIHEKKLGLIVGDLEKWQSLHMS